MKRGQHWFARALVVLLGAAACAGVSTTAASASPVSGSYMQVVAHQDDDLLFMNPDIQNTINAGRPITSVFLTAGEAGTTGGDGGPDTSVPLEGTCRPQPIGQDHVGDWGLTRADYAGCRREGSRKAWAQMAGVPSDWDQNLLTFTTPDGARQVEADTLEGTRAAITLIFFDLPDWADDDQGGASLYHILYSGSALDTVMVSDSLVDHTQTYDLPDLTTMLADLYGFYAPTVLRLQDPMPDSRYEVNPAWDNDHSDHVMTSIIAARAGAGIGRLQIVNYRNYNIRESQVNLDLDQQAAKKITFDAYQSWDINAGSDNGYVEWPRREYHRFWTGTNWVGRNLDGLLQVFAVENGKLLMWSQTSARGGFTGPQSLGAPNCPLAPGISTSRNADGRVEVFGLCQDTFTTVTAYQSAVDTTSPSSWKWDALGNPNTTVGDPAQVGYPVATTDQNGEIQIFEKNGGGGISTATQTAPNAGFGGWTDLGGGPGVQDGLAVITNPQGRIELFAYDIVNGIGSIKHLYQPTPNGGFNTDATFAALEPASPPTVATNADGRLDVFYRLADGKDGHLGSDVGHTWQLQVGGGWATAAQNIVGQGGIGPVAVANAPSPADGSTGISDARIMLLEHNRGGGASLNRQVGPNDGYQPTWTDMGGFFAAEPALAADVSGEMYAFAIDGVGALEVAHQTSASGAAPFGAWTPEGD